MKPTPLIKRIQTSGQVVLELAAVFITIALLAYGSVKLFANQGLNMTTRIDRFKQSRMSALNTGYGASPEAFLYDSPNTIITIGDPTSSGYFKTLYFEDPNVNEAARLLEENYNIESVVFPYQLSQARKIAHNPLLQYVPCHEEPPFSGTWVRGHWEPPDYIEAIRSLVTQAKANAERAYNDFCNASAHFQEALNNPYIPGPFDPNPAAHPDEYGLTAADTTKLEQIRTSNVSNRNSLQLTIDNLNNAAPRLYNLLYRDMSHGGLNIIPNLNYIIAHIGDYECWDEFVYDPEGYLTIVHHCGVLPTHYQAIATLDSFFPTYVTYVSNSRITSNAIVSSIATIYTLLFDVEVTYDGLSLAKSTATMISSSLAGSSVDWTAMENLIRNNPNLTAEEKAEMLSNLEDLKNDPGSTTAYLSSFGSLQNIDSRLITYLGYTMKYWDNPEAAIPREKYLGLSKLEAWTLHEITYMNRLLPVYY